MGCNKHTSFSCGSIMWYNVTLFAVCLRNWINWNSWYSLKCLLSYFTNNGLHRVDELVAFLDALGKYQKRCKLWVKWLILIQVYGRNGMVLRWVSVYGTGNFGHLLAQNLADKRAGKTDWFCECLYSPLTTHPPCHLYLYPVSCICKMFQTSQNRVNNYKG